MSAAERLSWALGLTLAAPIVLLRYPPMADLPFHESLVALLRHFGDPAWQPPGLYSRSFGPPNQLFHVVAWALSFVCRTDTACKLVVGASVAAAAPAAARLARHFGKAEWCSFWVAPLTLSLPFHWGLVGNVVALPLLLLSLPALDEFGAHPTWRRAAVPAILIVLLYAAHESAVLVAALASALFAIRKDGGSRPVRLLPVGIAVTFAAFYAWWGRHLKAPSILETPNTFGPPFWSRIEDTPKVLFATAEAWPRAVLLGAYALSFVAMVILGARAVDRSDASASVVARIERYRLEWIGLGCLVAYLVGPYAFGGSTLLYERFLPFGVAILCVAVAPPARTAWPRLMPFIGAAIALATTCVSLPAFGVADRRFRDLDTLLPKIERNSAVAQLDVTPVSHGQMAPIVGAAGRILAERGGRLLFSFTDAPTSPVVVPPSHQWNEPVLRVMHDQFTFSPPRDLRFFRYVLVHLDLEWNKLVATVVRAFLPEARLVGYSGEWLLFESTLETVSLSAPDGRPPVDRPGSTLGERLSGSPH